MKNKLSKEDKELLKWYKYGFSDELKSVTRKVEVKYKEAYNLGANHALIGDDVSSVDLLTEEEILEMIKE
jgi:hypothetical protein